MPIGATSGGYVLYVGSESTWGAGAASYVLLPAEPVSGIDVVEALTDDLRRGQNIIGFNRMEGIHRTELSVSTLAYPDQIGFFLKSIMGKDTVSGSAPTVHTFDVISDTPSTATPSIAIAVKNDILTGSNVLVHKGLKCTNFTARFNVAEGFVTVESSFIGKGADLESITGTNEPGTNDPLRGWEAYSLLGGGGTELNCKVLEGEISIAREADAIYAVCDTPNADNRFADNVIHGMVGITGRITAVFDNVDLLTLYRAFGTRTLKVGFSNLGAGGLLRSLEFDLKKVTFGDSPAEIDHSGNHMTISYSFRGLYDAVTSKGIIVTLKNGRSSY